MGVARWTADRAVDKIRDRFGWEAVEYGPAQGSPIRFLTSFVNSPKRTFSPRVARDLAGSKVTARSGGSIQRLELDDIAVVVVADPERHRRGRVVDEHAPHVGRHRKEIAHRLPGLGVDAHDGVGVHAARPQFAIAVHDRVIGREERRDRKFLDLLRSWCRTRRSCRSRIRRTRAGRPPSCGRGAAASAGVGTG